MEVSRGMGREGKGRRELTSPPGFSSRKPRPGIGISNVQGIFCASVRIASME